jgi:hypothetical protein
VVARLGLSANLKPTAPAALPPPVRAAARPAAPLDARLADTAASVLGGPIGATTNFFDAGFTSITLLQFGAELGTVLGRPVEPLRLFQHPNLRALAAALELDDRPAAGTVPAAPAAPSPGARPGPDRRRDGHARLRDARRRARERVRETGDGAPG